MISFPEPRIIDAGGVNLAVYENNGDERGDRPPVILVHGWPEIAYSWINQMGPLSDAGFRTIALDLKGFGRSDAPKDPALYDIECLTGDLTGLLDALDTERAVFCGHDWGGALVWGMGQWRPERVAGIIGVCTPVRPRPPASPISIFKQRYTEKHYFVQFQERDVPERLFESDPERFFALMFRKPAPRERWPALIPGVFDLPAYFKTAELPPKEDVIVSNDVIERYAAAFKRSGFHGGINIYRNVDRNWALMEGRDQIIHAPSLWIGADLDIFIPPEFSEGMGAIVPDLEKHVLPDCGHWVMWEKPDALNALIVNWLNQRFSI